MENVLSVTCDLIQDPEQVLRETIEGMKVAKVKVAPKSKIKSLSAKETIKTKVWEGTCLSATMKNAAKEMVQIKHADRTAVVHTDTKGDRTRQ